MSARLFTETVSVNDIHWLAGIVEGEGCVSLAGPKGPRRYPQLSIEMTDIDIITRVATLLGARVSKRTRKLPCKDLYRTSSCGRRGARWLMILYSLLGSRRRARIREVLRVYGTTFKMQPARYGPHFEL